LPDPGTDTVVIPATLTAAVILDDSRTIPATTIEDEVYGLVQGSGVTTTLGGDLIVGNGTSKDGMFTFGAGSELALGANNLKLNNCKLRSNSTSGSWAKITGTGAVHTGSIANPKQSVILNYISFQHTGVITFALSTVNGNQTNRLEISRSAFVGNGAVTIGTAGFTLPSTVLIFDYNDIRDGTGNIIFYTTGNDPGATELHSNYCTWYSTTNVRSIAFPRKMQVKYSVFHRYNPNNVNLGMEITHDSNLYIHDGQTSGSSFLTIKPGVSVVSSLLRSFIFSPSTQANSHAIQFSAGAGGNTVAENIFELRGSEPNILNTSSGYVNTISKNIVIGSSVSSLITIGSAYSAGTLSMTQNTMIASAATAAGLLLAENCSITGGAITVNSNLVQPLSTTSPYLCVNNSGAATMSITTSDYNATGGADLAAAYKEVDSVGGTTNNLYGVSAQFYDATRSFATWGKSIAGTDGTDTAAIALFLAINGYNATSKIQSDTPSGVRIYGDDAALVNWVREGYIPHNMALETAGEGGVSIGAMQPRHPGGRATMMGF
jgi:hypothetical protein